MENKGQKEALRFLTEDDDSAGTERRRTPLTSVGAAL